MKSFYEFLQIIEDYQNINYDAEQRQTRKLNMTSQLPLPKDRDVLKQLRGLTRGFHLNTIIERMSKPWIVGLKDAPVRYDLKEDEKYKWLVNPNNKQANNQYKAAYSLFKQEIANAINALPYKQGFDIISQQYTDIMKQTKQFLQNISPEESDLIESMRKAFDIYWKVFGPSYYSQARNFANFFEIVKDEFMRFKETLPTMGEDDMDDLADQEIIEPINKEIERYHAIEKQYK